MNLSHRDTRLVELMDDPGCDPEQLRRTLRRFALVNRAVSHWGSVYRSHLRPLLGRLGRPARLLDIGCGGGDVVRRLARLAHRDGFEIEALGIDPDPRAIAVARSAKTMPGISFFQAYSRTLVDEGARFDIVISNHLLHHLDESRFEELIADSEALTIDLCVHSDIARGRLAYCAFAVGAAPIAPGSFLLVDGLRSIRRSYTPAELRARLPRAWTVERPGAFRLLAVHRTGAPPDRG
ncbi:MAG: class I SAM-dependent methyltransferase [Leucobacter sp.]